jgi:hypothetical protein|tara:strand:+ start:933 stop:1169 length:237 start_codon:yes stop_codon:yes gene_type:complete
MIQDMHLSFLYCLICIFIIFISLNVYIKHCNKNTGQPNPDDTVENLIVDNNEKKNNNIIIDLINSINNKQKMFFNNNS